MTLKNKLEEITVSEFRKQPGEVFAQVGMGKTFVVTKNGSAVAVVSKVPGEQLTMDVRGNGRVKYVLAS